jgi:hypothetical protein
MRRALIVAVALSGCAPAAWYRPDTAPEIAAMDQARCKLTAKGITPDLGPVTPVYSYATAAGTGIADGIMLGIERAENFGLCMEASGYARGPAWHVEPVPVEVTSHYATPLK